MGYFSDLPSLVWPWLLMYVFSVKKGTFFMGVVTIWTPLHCFVVSLAHANCTPFFSPKHLDFVTEKNSFFCHLENTFFQSPPNNSFFISFAHFLLFLGGSNNQSLVQNQRAYQSFSPKKNVLANLNNTNFWIFWKTIKDGRCSHILYMST